jgi:microcystin-dependent protein
MSDTFVGEIRMFAGNFAPAGWMFCEGQLLSISQNDILFALIGTTYGGDGQTTFALPDLRGRLPIHLGTRPAGSTFIIGQAGGQESVALTTSQIPMHTHVASASSGVGHLSEPQDALPAADRDFAAFSDQSANTFAPAAVTPAGGGVPHSNVPPFLCLNFIISLFGVFPSQN